jgi:glucokinase
MNTLAVDIGGTKLSLALFDDSGRIVERAIRPTDRDGGPAYILGQIAAILKDWHAHHSIDRCAVGFGGPVDYAAQRVVQSTHVGGWTGFDLAAAIEKIAGVGPLIDNDANAGALGEALYGAGRGYRPLFYMTLSTGIGGGLVLENDHVYRGADSYAGEIGHLTIRPDGPECLCGSHGCFERLCCGLWLERDHGRPAHELFQDPAFVQSYVVDLALGLKTAIMLLNPARIVIGGGISNAGDALFIPLRAELSRRITDWSRARVDVVPAALGGDSVLYGAFALAQRASAG